MAETTNGTEWLEKIKAVPTSLRTYAVALYAGYVQFVVPMIADSYASDLPDSLPEVLRSQAWVAMCEQLTLGGAIVIGAFILAESVRGVMPAKKRNQTVEARADATTPS